MKKIINKITIISTIKIKIEFESKKNWICLTFYLIFSYFETNCDFVVNAGKTLIILLCCKKKSVLLALRSFIIFNYLKEIWLIIRIELEANIFFKNICNN